MANRLQAIDLEVIVATAHTDSTDAAAYNMNLSLHRDEAVKAYLVRRGIPTEPTLKAKVKKQPIATNSTLEGHAQNRRVIIEIIGDVTRTH